MIWSEINLNILIVWGYYGTPKIDLTAIWIENLVYSLCQRLSISQLVSTSIDKFVVLSTLLL